MLYAHEARGASTTKRPGPLTSKRPRNQLGPVAALVEGLATSPGRSKAESGVPVLKTRRGRGKWWARQYLQGGSSQVFDLLLQVQCSHAFSEV